MAGSLESGGLRRSLRQCNDRLRAAELAPNSVLKVDGRAVERAVTFSDVLPHSPFWYENANGLVEIAVNRGRADRHFSLVVGDEIEVSAR